MEISDMLVALHDKKFTQTKDILPIEIKRAAADDKDDVRMFVLRNFSARWANQVAASFTGDCITCFVAKVLGKTVGFACYDVKAKGFFGPLGVAADFRTRGVGSALTGAVLAQMQAEHYAYAIIGGVGEAQRFYEKLFDAQALCTRAEIGNEDFYKTCPPEEILPE